MPKTADQHSCFASIVNLSRSLIPLLTGTAATLASFFLGGNPVRAQVPIDELLAEAERSPLLESKFPASQIRQEGLQKVRLRNGVTLDLEVYSEATRLDRVAENRILFEPTARTRYLSDAPKYSETITELSDRLIVDRVLTMTLKPGTCLRADLADEIAQFCFRPKSGRLSSALRAELSTIRSKLDNAPPQTIIHGSVTAASAKSMTDAELLDLLLNGEQQTLRRVSILPRAVHDGRPGSTVGEMRDFQRSLGPGLSTRSNNRRTTKLPVVGLETNAFDPATEATTDRPSAAGSQPTRYFLTGFTFGRQISDTWEKTFAPSTLFTDRYYVQISYQVGAGFGLRFPFAVNVTATEPTRRPGGRVFGSDSSERRVTLSVDPIDVDTAGKPAYPAVGLDPEKYFSGREFVLEVTAGCRFYASIPGEDLEYDCPSIEKSASRDLDPVLGSERSELGELWLDGKITGLGIDAGIGEAYLDLGIAADLTQGLIRLQAKPLGDSRLDLPAEGGLSFDRREATSFIVENTGSSRRFGFQIEEPEYGFRVEITPQLRISLEIDLGIYEYDRIVGPYRLDFLSIGAGFLLPHHSGTTASHSYEFESGPRLPTENAPKEETSTARCSTRSKSICGKRDATCEVIRGIDGSSSDLCRWDSVSSAPACADTAGIWTAADSKYARRHPDAVPPGKAGACITEVSNLRRIID